MRFPHSPRGWRIYGSPTDKNVEEVEKGFKDALVDSKLNIVYSGYCDNWLAEIAETHVNKGLEVTDDIVGVMCGNDDLASQVVKPPCRTGRCCCTGCRTGCMPAYCRRNPDHDGV